MYYGVGHEEVGTNFVIPTIVKSKGKTDMQNMGSCGKVEDIGPGLVLMISERG